MIKVHSVASKALFEEPIEGTLDLPEKPEVDDEKILEEMEEFADYMKKKYETPGI